MLPGLALILVCQLLGEGFVRLTGLPVPGPIVGMVLFWGWLAVRRPPADSTEVKAAEGLLGVLPMLFVPAGIGVVAYLGPLGAHAPAVVVGLAVSWLVALLVTGGVATLLRPRGSA